MAGAPTDAGKMHVSQSQKYLRVIDADTGDVVQLAITDTGLNTVDGLDIFALGTVSMPSAVSDGPNAVTTLAAAIPVGLTYTIPATTDARLIWIQNDAGNANSMFVFGVMELTPGESIVIPTTDNAGWITILGTNADTVNYAVLSRA